MFIPRLRRRSLLHGAGRAKQKEIKSRQRRTEDCLWQYFPQDLTMNIGESSINAVVADGQLGVIDAQEVQDGERGEGPRPFRDASLRAA
jgi:hypothetical protein